MLCKLHYFSFLTTYTHIEHMQSLFRNIDARAIEISIADVEATNLPIETLWNTTVDVSNDIAYRSRWERIYSTDTRLVFNTLWRTRPTATWCTKNQLEEKLEPILDLISLYKPQIRSTWQSFCSLGINNSQALVHISQYLNINLKRNNNL